MGPGVVVVVCRVGPANRARLWLAEVDLFDVELVGVWMFLRLYDPPHLSIALQLQRCLRRVACWIVARWTTLYISCCMMHIACAVR